MLLIVVLKELPAAPSLNLIQGQCELATDYVKKKNTLRLRYSRYIHTYVDNLLYFVHRLINGAEYLFTAKDEADCNSWINHINAAIHHRQCQLIT